MQLSNIILRFFKWFCRPDLHRYIEGDLIELYHEKVETGGQRKANIKLGLEVLKLFRPSMVKQFQIFKNSNNTAMLRNYFKVSFRSLMKNPMSSFINIFGLAVAIGATLVVYAFFKFDYSIDQFHEHKNEVYLATFFIDQAGETEQYGNSPAPLAKAIKTDFAQVEMTCRVKDKPVVIKRGDKVFHERVRYADPEFLDMLTFPIRWGNASSLKDLNSVILSDNMAIKYFGDANPVGEELLIIFGEGLKKTFKVSGVAEPFPDAHIIDFDFLINFENHNFSDPNVDMLDWKNLVNATLVKINDPANKAIVESGLIKYNSIQNDLPNNWKTSSAELVSIADLHLKSSEIRNDISFDDSVEARQGMPVIGILMLLLACFNYINIAIVSATKRLKEIGLRKVIGARRTNVMIQFLAENVLVTFFALLLGMVLSVTIFMPWFSGLASVNLSMDLLDINLWIYMIGIVLLTGVISGLYPAIFISGFDTVNIFKGKVRFGQKNIVTKIFLGMQLILTCAGITCAVIFVQNNEYQNAQSWGYNQKSALYARVSNAQEYQKLHDVMNAFPDVKMLSGAQHHLGDLDKSMTITRPDRDYRVKNLNVEAGYLETMGVSLKSGRFFDENQRNEQGLVVVNETFVTSLGLTEPIGETFKIDTVNYRIIGVTEDFHMYSFFSKKQPTYFTRANDDDFRFLAMHIESGAEIKMYDELKAQWTSLFPEIPFDGGFQADIWGTYFMRLNTAEHFYKVIASIAIMLASLGLYGLISLNVVGRSKEFSIRKVLGADLINLSKNVSRPYLILVSVSLISGIPFSYWLGTVALDLLYHYPMPMTISGILIAASILILVVLVVIASQVRNLATANPVEGLRNE